MHKSHIPEGEKDSSSQKTKKKKERLGEGKKAAVLYPISSKEKNSLRPEKEGESTQPKEGKMIGPALIGRGGGTPVFLNLVEGKIKLLGEKGYLKRWEGKGPLGPAERK